MKIEKSVSVACSPKRAFKVFTEQIGEWWPLDKGYSFGGDKRQDIYLEPREGGQIYERYTDGSLHVIGDVVTCSPPDHIAFTWKHPGWDGATKVDVRFDGNDDRTEVQLVHSGWEAVGAEAKEAHDGYAQGWNEVLADYSEQADAPKPVHGRLDWVELPANDPKAAADFYAAVFDWQITHDENWPDFPMFKDADDFASGAFNRQWTPSKEAGIVPHITTHDIDGTLKRIGEAGGETVKPKTLIHESMGWYALFRDPAGNTLGLFESSSG